MDTTTRLEPRHRAVARTYAAAVVISFVAADAKAQGPVEPAPLDPAIASAAAAHGIDAGKLQRLVDRARATKSDAMILVRDGATIGTWRFDRPAGPIEAMSATKSIVALAVGRLLADGRLESLDVPVCRFFPEWDQGRKAKITIRHLLTQRSGLQCEPVTTEIYRSPDFVQLALAAELTDEPGRQFRYNNKACNLLAGVVQKASGRRMDVLIGEELFEPLGITDWSWTLDKAGNPHGMSGLQIRPEDLLAIGQMMLDQGVWRNEQVLPGSFVAEATRDQVLPPPDAKIETVGQLYGQRYGLLWWLEDERETAITDRLLGEWRELGVPAAFISKMEALKGVRGDSLRPRAVELAGGEDAWNNTTWAAGRPDFDIVGFTNVGFSAEGYLGQYLVVVPKQRIVAVRMRRAQEETEQESRTNSFREFKLWVADLVKE
jgi:CubicO group peptidase (beta-lactamase class C family)